MLLEKAVVLAMKKAETAAFFSIVKRINSLFYTEINNFFRRI